MNLFGSRAKGNYRFGSDVNLAIMNKGVNAKTLTKLRSKFEERNLPYKVDLVDHINLKKQEFIDHTQRVGYPFIEIEKRSFQQKFFFILLHLTTDAQNQS